MTVLVILACIACFVGGFALHTFLVREKAATKTELSTWSSRLRLALAQDEKNAKAAVEKIALELEKKV